jgi:hypothetical protein
LDIVARFKTVTTEFNTRKVETELDKTERAFKESERAADRWSDRLDREADEAGRGVKGRLRGTGSEIGAEFSENIGEGFRSGDFKGVVLETFTSLGPALGVAGLALGAGAAIISSMIQGAEEQAEKLRQLGRDILGYVQDGMYDQAEKEAVVAKALGFDSIEEALPRLVEVADRAGVGVKDAFDYIASGGREMSDDVTTAFGKVEDSAAALKSLGAGPTDIFGTPSEGQAVVSTMGELSTLAGDVATSMGQARKDAATLAALRVDPKWATVLAATRAGARDAGQVPYATGGRG